MGKCGRGGNRDDLVGGDQGCNYGRHSRVAICCEGGASAGSGRRTVPFELILSGGHKLSAVQLC